MSESELLKGSVTRAHLDASAPALAAATRKKRGHQKTPSTPYCGPGKKKPSKKAPGKKKPAKKKPAKKK